MFTKRWLVFFTIIVVLLGLAACTRTLSPEAQITPSPEEGAPAETSDVMEQIWQLATQTAMAQQGQAGADQTPAAPQETETTVAETETAPAPTETPAPTATQITVPSPTPGIPDTYTLKSGEFPFCIARRFDVNQYDLLNLNGLSLNSRPQTGFTLRLPPPSSDFSGNRTLRAHPTTYTVGAGENIYEVACKFGDVSPEAIAAANGLEKPYNIQPGQTLQIP